MKTIEKARFDTRITVEQKETFEYAASLGGYRTLTEFVLHAAQVEAEKIIEKHNSILTTKKDREIFFKALFNPPAPGNKLKLAAERYKKTLKK